MYMCVVGCVVLHFTPHSRVCHTRHGHAAHTTGSTHTRVRYGAVPHWAKVEVPATSASTGTSASTSTGTSASTSTGVKVGDTADAARRLQRLQRRIRERYPLQAVETARAALDPRLVLSAGSPVVTQLVSAGAAQSRAARLNAQGGRR